MISLFPNEQIMENIQIMGNDSGIFIVLFFIYRLNKKY